LHPGFRNPVEPRYVTQVLLGRKIIVEAEDSFKNIFKKKYKTTTEAKLGKEAEKVLDSVWDKGKRKVKPESRPKHDWKIKPQEESCKN